LDRSHLRQREARAGFAKDALGSMDDLDDKDEDLNEDVDEELEEEDFQQEEEEEEDDTFDDDKLTEESYRTTYDEILTS
jgi:hypothetical protein